MPTPSPDGGSDQRRGPRTMVRAIAVAIFMLILGMVGFSFASLVLPGAELMVDHPSLADFFAFGLIFLAFPFVGLVVVWNRPRNPIGWIFLAIGFGITTSVFGSEYAGRVVHVGWDLPGPEFVAWAGAWTWAIASGLALTFAVLLFPDGRLPGPRWRPVAWLAAIAMGAVVAAEALRPDALTDAYGDALVNPFGVAGPVGEAATFVAGGGLLAILAIGLFSIASLVVRFRQARGVERQQIKGLLYPVALFGIGLVAAAVAQSDVVWTLTLAAMAAIPVGAGISILRYRLFDIDLVINRTLVYLSLSVVLGALYVGFVLALQIILSPFTENSAPAVAVSTLAVAALFGPVRRSLQGVVNRRFYRSRYDAQRTLEGFAASLRDEVDVGALTTGLRTAAQRTLQPASATVWLRERPS